jgi:hypothetical protein
MRQKIGVDSLDFVKANKELPEEPQIHHGKIH